MSDAQTTEELRCPFCGYRAENEYGIMFHMEDIHPEGESPFMIKEDRTQAPPPVDAREELEDDQDFVECPQDGCGETILFTELESHIYMHKAEDDEDDEAEEDLQAPKRLKRSESSSSLGFDARISPALRNVSESSYRKVSSRHYDGQNEDTTNGRAKVSWREILNMPNLKKQPVKSSTTKKTHRRLGKAELGPHAHEKQMPDWLKRLLETDGQPRAINTLSLVGKSSRSRIIENHASGIIPVIKCLLQQDSSTDYAYLCHESVQHISKLRTEGGFCGYRNIQMLTSYINGARSQGFNHFQGKVPSISQIQDFIEHAWDIGIHAQGRVETGGIRGTRKYIGTPEAQAMLLSLDIACGAQGLKSMGINSKDEQSRDYVSAYQLLFQYVEDYFSADCLTPEAKVRMTNLAPLYFQHPGHSLTIIGFEKGAGGAGNVLVFDPMFHDSTDVIKNIGQDFTVKRPGDLLRAYRRSAKYLRKYSEFEVLRLTPP